MTTWHVYCFLHCQEITVLGPKCHSAECLEPVDVRVHWVTGPIDVCGPCGERWFKVAKALGMVLRVDVIEYTPPGLDDTEQRPPAPELT